MRGQGIGVGWSWVLLLASVLGLLGFIWSGRKPGPAPFSETRLMMDTLVTVKAWGNKDAASQAIGEAFRAMDQVDRLASFFRPESELSRLNLSGSISPGATFSEILDRAAWAFRATGGGFDPTFSVLHRAWGFYDRMGRQPDPDELSACLSHVGWNRQVSLSDPPGMRGVAIPPRGVGGSLAPSKGVTPSWGSDPPRMRGAAIRPRGAGGSLAPSKGVTPSWGSENRASLASGALLDFGGIAGGFAIEKAREAMGRYGCAAIFIDEGGDLWMEGTRPDGRPWRVAVRDPRDNGVLAIIENPGPMAVSTSGDYERFVMVGNRRINHIFDPRTGLPAEYYRSVTVIASTPVEADVWSTALFALPDNLAREAARRERLPALFLPASGSAWMSETGPVWFSDLKP